jgi:hypothetical protein
MYAPSTLPAAKIVEFLNTIDPMIGKLKLLGDLSPLVDEAPADDKGRVAIGLLELVSDYVEQLEAAVRMFANRVPRHQNGGAA